MIKKAIIAVVVIVTAAAMVFAAGNADQNKSASNSNQETQQNSADNGSTSNSDEQAAISSAEAKKIAEKYIEEPGASAGTPTLSKQDGKLVYTVPIIYNGKNVGEIDIDAQSGKNLGGAGGAP